MSKQKTSFNNYSGSHSLQVLSLLQITVFKIGYHLSVKFHMFKTISKPRILLIMLVKFKILQFYASD